MPRSWARLREKYPQEYNFFGINLALIETIRHSRRNGIWIAKCLARDDHVCRECGKRDTLEVHHKKPLFVIMIEYGIDSLAKAVNCEALFDPKNGITLCKRCHDLTEPRLDQTEDETTILVLDRKTWMVKYRIKIPYYNSE